MPLSEIHAPTSRSQRSWAYLQLHRAQARPLYSSLSSSSHPGSSPFASSCGWAGFPTTTDPAEILTGLNRRLLGRSKGFTTAIAVRVALDGEADLVIAGHLNPYLNGRELVMEAALPLGLTADAVYENTAVTLAAGDTLTLLTDGVLEARDAKTHELFGFDRTLAISAQPAAEIAAIAQRFGQDDDIAVLTLTRVVGV